MNPPIPIILLVFRIAENLRPEESICLLIETDDVSKLKRLLEKDFLRVILPGTFSVKFASFQEKNCLIVSSIFDKELSPDHVQSRRLYIC